MEKLSAAEQAWIWMARVTGLATLGYAVIGLQFAIPTPAYILIGGLLGGEFAYKAQRKAKL